MPDLFLGIDIGTSGARAIAIDREGAVRSEARAAMSDFGPNHRSPEVWWSAVRTAVSGALKEVDPRSVQALAVDGTSGTMLAVEAEGAPSSDGIMYNDPCGDTAIIDRIAAAAPADNAAKGANSGLARAMLLAGGGADRMLHQADWISMRFSGRFVGDVNNALKTGFDPQSGTWPGWIAKAGLDATRLPAVVDPGTPVGPVTGETAREFGFSPDTLVVAGTTDGCASFVATGAGKPGDGVTALGTTMTIKLLSEKPISAPEYGIYSHRILGYWLAGGASNTGGNVLLKHFDSGTLKRLSTRIDPETDCQLDYYPLSEPGERFPIADPSLAPRLMPRPEDDAEFLKGLLDGISRIEALAYSRLCELGAPALSSMRTVGGGAQNPAWTRIRERRLGVPMVAPTNIEAAYGTALLARRGAR